jgi:hypothetical protein
MPTQRDSRLHSDERRCRRVLLLAALCSSPRSQRLNLGSVGRLVLWLRLRRDVQVSLTLRSRMLANVFNLELVSNYDVISQMRFSKRHIRYIVWYLGTIAQTSREEETVSRAARPAATRPNTQQLPKPQ